MINRGVILNNFRFEIIYKIIESWQYKETILQISTKIKWLNVILVRTIRNFFVFYLVSKKCFLKGTILYSHHFLYAFLMMVLMFNIKSENQIAIVYQKNLNKFFHSQMNNKKLGNLVRLTFNGTSDFVWTIGTVFYPVAFFDARDTIFVATCEFKTIANRTILLVTVIWTVRITVAFERFVNAFVSWTTTEYIFQRLIILVKSHTGSVRYCFRCRVVSVSN